MPKRLPYDQFCPIAKTLDLVGDRWVLPIVRELHLGPLRYTDLQRALPGIGTDVLADRLRRLASINVIERGPDGGYRLSANGRSLRPLLREMLRWGGGRLARSDVPDQLDPRLGVQAVVINAQHDPARSAAIIDLHIGNLVCHVRLHAEGADAQLGESSSPPDATALIRPEMLYPLALGAVSIESAVADGTLVVTGDETAVEALLSGVGMPASMRHLVAS